jgi:hypothetical protein
MPVDIAHNKSSQYHEPGMIFKMSSIALSSLDNANGLPCRNNPMSVLKGHQNANKINGAVQYHT